MANTIYLAITAWLLLALGYTCRKSRFRHVTLMVSGIVLDFGIVIYLQLTKDAVQKALSLELSLLRQLHIACSTGAVMLYIPVLVLGGMLLTGRGSKNIRLAHIRIATAAFMLRTIGLLFMFTML